MSKYIDSEKLIAEIERMREINRKAFEAERIESGILHGRAQAFNHLFEFITSLQQEQPEGGCSEKPNNLLREQPSLPSNLDKAAEAYSENILANGEDMFDAIADGFRAGAEWMAGQGEEAEVGYWNQIGLSVRLDKSLERLGFKGGDKVRVQITKK